MAENRHELWELQQMQGLPLEIKVRKTEIRIKEWYEHYNGEVYVSFSGGKDSTVLLTIARKLYPDIKAVFFDTGLEFPEVREHVRTFENVTVIRPKMTFPEVIKKYGFNFPSKDVSQRLYYAKKGKKWALNALDGLNTDGTASIFKERYKKWKFLLDAPFIISDRCCVVMKEKPAQRFHRENGLYVILGTMAEESERRKTAWLKTGCNSFESKIPNSTPMSFWTDQDVLHYIRDNNIKIASVYGEIINADDTISLFNNVYADKLKTTGEQRTGCMFCPVGCHLDKGENKFQRMKKTHPKIWNYCMNQLGMAEVLDYIGVAKD